MNVIKSSHWYPAIRSTGNPDSPFEHETCHEFKVTLTNGDIVIVPEGFKTDLATVPRVFWPLIAPFGRDEGAFILHDHLLETRYITKYSREFCDRQMDAFQQRVETSSIRIRAMVTAVRLWSWIKTKTKPVLNR